jgi:choline kinase
VKGLILAAGRGSRMGQATADRPKCMTPLLDRPLIEWQISAFQEAGVAEIGVVTGYRSEALEPYGSCRFRNAEWETTNMVRSLESAADWLADDVCIVSYSDIVYSHDAITELLAHDAPLAVLFDPYWLDQWGARFDDPLEDAESFRIDDCGNIIEIGQRITDLADVQGQFMGLVRFSPLGWCELRGCIDLLPEHHRRTVDMTSVLQLIISAGRVPIAGVPYDGRWAEVDSEHDLEYAARAMSDREPPGKV